MCFLIWWIHFFIFLGDVPRCTNLITTLSWEWSHGDRPRPWVACFPRIRISIVSVVKKGSNEQITLYLTWSSSEKSFVLSLSLAAAYGSDDCFSHDLDGLSIPVRPKPYYHTVYLKMYRYIQNDTVAVATLVIELSLNLLKQYMAH